MVKAKLNLIEWLFLLFMVSLYFENWQVPLFSNFLLTSKLQLLFILTTILISHFKMKGLMCKSLENTVLLSIFFCYFLIINFCSSIIYNGEMVSLTLISNFLTLLCLLKAFTSQPFLIHKVALLNIIAMDIICSFAINDIGIDINSEFTLGENRLRIFGMNPNGLSMYAALSSACCIYLFFKVKKTMYKMLLIVSFLCCAELIVMCGSKGGLVYLFICIIIMLGDKIRRTGKYMLLLLPLVIVFVFYLFSYIMNSDVFVSRFAEEDISDGRFALFERGIKVFLQSPIFGVGMSGYDYYMNAFFGQIRPTHNGYLDIAAYTGLVGLALFILYIWRQGKSVIKLRKLGGGNVLLIVFLIFILNFAKDGGVVFSKFTWIHVAIMISYTSLLKLHRGNNFIHS